MKTVLATTKHYVFSQSPSKSPSATHPITKKSTSSKSSITPTSLSISTTKSMAPVFSWSWNCANRELYKTCSWISLKTNPSTTFSCYITDKSSAESSSCTKKTFFIETSNLRTFLSKKTRLKLPISEPQNWIHKNSWGLLLVLRSSHHLNFWVSLSPLKINPMSESIPLTQKSRTSGP